MCLSDYWCMSYTQPLLSKSTRASTRATQKGSGQALTSACEHIFQNKSDRRLRHMYPKHVGHENGGCGHLGRAPLTMARADNALSAPTFGGHSCKKDCMVAPHESVLVRDHSRFDHPAANSPPLVGFRRDGCLHCVSIHALDRARRHVLRVIAPPSLRRDAYR